MKLQSKSNFELEVSWKLFASERLVTGIECRMATLLTSSGPSLVAVSTMQIKMSLKQSSNALNNLFPPTRLQL